MDKRVNKNLKRNFLNFFPCGKKGMTASFLVSMIIVLVAFSLIGTVIYQFTADADDKQLETLCQQSVALRATTALQINTGQSNSQEDIDLIKGTVKSVPVLCRTITKEISGDRKEIMRQISDKIARCWWMFGEGRYEEVLHDTKVGLAITGFDNLHNQCFNCYVITVEDFEGRQITPEDLYDFMYEETYAPVDKTYLEYIQEYGGPGRFAYVATDPALNIKKPLNIKPHQGYTISMMPKNKNVDEDIGIWGAVKVAVGITGTAAVGACIYFTWGACAFVAGPGALTTAALSLTLAGGSITNAGIGDLKAAIYGEREVSSIYFDEINSGQERCGSGDLAGE